MTIFMRLYIDSAEVSILGPLLKTGVFHGVTTNPLILKQAGVPMKQLSLLANRGFALGVKELFLQSWGEDVASLQPRR